MASALTQVSVSCPTWRAERRVSQFKSVGRPNDKKPVHSAGCVEGGGVETAELRNTGLRTTSFKRRSSAQGSHGRRHDFFTCRAMRLEGVYGSRLFAQIECAAGRRPVLCMVVL